MDIPIQQRIHIDRLLMHREERLASIHTIEQRIQQLIDQPYPFDPPPPDLPSLQKRKKR